MFEVIYYYYLTKYSSSALLRPFLCENINLIKNRIEDPINFVEYEINLTGYDIINMCNGKNNMLDIVNYIKKISCVGDGDMDTIRKINNEVKEYIYDLNKKCFLNFNFRPCLNIIKMIMEGFYMYTKQYRYEVKGENIIYLSLQVFIFIIRRWLLLFLFPVIIILVGTRYESS